MPIFDFICSKCKIVDERLVNSKDVDKQYCRSCENNVMERQSNVSNMAFALKGVWFKSHGRY